MIEGADVIAGAVVLLMGMGIGAAGTQFTHRLLERAGGQTALPARPTCSCGDPPSMHDPQTKQCNGRRLIKRKTYPFEEWVTCRCRQYDGPEPLPEFYAPEISP